MCGYASEVDCVFKLREAMEEVAEELLKLAKTDLPSLQRRNDRWLVREIAGLSASDVSQEAGRLTAK